MGTWQRTRKFTFKDITIVHEIGGEGGGGEHRIVVSHGTHKDVAGPWRSFNTMNTYDWAGRYFVAQCTETLLPQCFELVNAKEVELTTVD